MHGARLHPPLPHRLPHGLHHPLRPPLVTAAGVLAVTLALRLRDPHVSGSWGFCPLRALTGLDCPACGGLRAVNDLTHLRLDAAFHSNALFVLSVPVLVAAWAWWVVRTGRGHPPRGAGGRERRTRERVAWAALGATVLAFTVFRNTPWGHAYWA